jgi:hypothetical protein
VAFHDRINRTAELVGIKLPKSRSRNKRSGYDSSSESGSAFDSDSSDSVESSIQSFTRSDKAQMKPCAEERIIPPPSALRGGPPPPPPVNWPFGIPIAPRPTPPWKVPSCVPTPPRAPTPVGIALNSVSYDSTLVYPANFER